MREIFYQLKENFPAYASVLPHPGGTAVLIRAHYPAPFQRLPPRAAVLSAKPTGTEDGGTQDTRQGTGGRRTARRGQAMHRDILLPISGKRTDAACWGKSPKPPASVNGRNAPNGAAVLRPSGAVLHAQNSRRPLRFSTMFSWLQPHISVFYKSLTGASSLYKSHISFLL